MKGLSWSARVALLAIVVCASQAGAETVRCERAIAKAGAAFLQAKIKAVSKCAGADVANGTSTCPDATTTAAIGKAATKLTATIAKACGGSDRTCNADLLDEDLPATVGWPQTCPNVGHETCNNLITSCAGIAECLACVNGEVANESINLSYGFLELPSTTDPVLNRCQIAIGKATSAFLGAQSRAYQKCWDGRLNGKHADSCVPTAAGDGKYQAAIAKAETKRTTTIAKACGGADKVLGGGDDLTPAQIGFPANCPPVTTPDGEPCGAVVTDLSGLVACVDCLAELEGACVDRLQVPQFASYPTACTDCLSPDAAGPCPSTLTFTADGPNVDLDTGWTGLGHDAGVPTNGILTLAVSGCAGTSAPNCGPCTIDGPLPNAGGAASDNRRCQHAQWKQCASDPECGADAPCIFFFGPPLPLVAGGIATCVLNEIAGSVTGTIDLSDGSSSSVVPLHSKVHPSGTGDVSAPCPNCVGGLCDTGPRTGFPCTTMGTGIFGDVSLDCPPDPGSNAGTLGIDLAIATGVQTATLTTASPLCTQTGYNAKCVGGANANVACSNESECPGGQCGFRCFCDTCNNAASEPCMSDAECPDPPGPTGPICGGKRCRGGSNDGTPCLVVSECPGGGKCGRPGEPTQPNACLDDTSTAIDGKICAPIGGNEGECPEGPVSQHCSIETFRTCSDTAACVNVAAGGTCLGCVAAGQTCISAARPCFLDSGLVGGSVSVAGATEVPCGDLDRPVVGTFFCVAPVATDAVNTAGGLPALGRARIPGRVEILP